MVLSNSVHRLGCVGAVSVLLLTKGFTWLCKSSTMSSLQEHPSSTASCSLDGARGMSQLSPGFTGWGRGMHGSVSLTQRIALIVFWEYEWDSDLQNEFEYVLEECLPPGKSPREEQKEQQLHCQLSLGRSILCFSGIWYIWQAWGDCAAEIWKSFDPGIPEQGQMK